ncbi:hypothetical protein KEM55_001544, partial [Ascosphaera atra]
QKQQLAAAAAASKAGKPKKAPTPPETKKQRQRRLKKEAEKELAAEAERQRRALMEKQLHLAREAERREEAKKGNKGVSVGSAWKSGTPPAASNVPSVAGTPASGSPAPASAAATLTSPQPQLLDTFEPTPAEKEDEGKWAERDLPSEEEQMRMLEEDEQWTTVPSKKEKKGGANASVKSEEGDGVVAKESPSTSVGNGANGVATTAAAPLPKAAPAAPVKTKGGIPDFAKVFGDVGSHPLDSDWAA